MIIDKSSSGIWDLQDLHCLYITSYEKGSNFTCYLFWGQKRYRIEAKSEFYDALTSIVLGGVAMNILIAVKFYPPGK